MSNESLSTGLSGIIGVAVTFGLGLLVFGIFHVRRSRSTDEDRPATTATVAG